MWKILVFSAAAVSILNKVSCIIVEVENGKIKGTILQTRLGTDFYAFRNIPYGEPPIGALRFKAPRPAKPWHGVLNCTDYGPVCWQVTTLPTSEDCLRLNVFTKNLPTNGKSNLRAVIVYIHSGGNISGSPRDYGPAYLMDRDIILVTIQFRLGVLGFLALETEDAPGNAGLKDQSLALQWVRKNIRSFGGDPERVTLAGITSGSIAVAVHMLSPMSEGLFHNAILQSGTVQFNQKITTNNFDLAEKIADIVNCTKSSVAEMTQCFVNKPAADLSNASTLPFFICAITWWQPVIEKKSSPRDHDNQERFLTGDPKELLREGKFSKVNILTGTSDELFSVAANILKDANATSYWNENFNQLAPTCLAFSGTKRFTEAEISVMLRKYYFPYFTVDIRQTLLLHQLFVDGYIKHPTHRFVRYVRDLTNVYYYKMTYIGQFSRLPNPRNIPIDVAHGDDLQYIFYPNIVTTHEFQATDPENFIVERLTRMWEQFATNGNPNDPTDEYLSQMVWPLHNSETEFYLDIGNNMVEKNGKDLRQMAVWDRIFQPY